MFTMILATRLVWIEKSIRLTIVKHDSDWALTNNNVV